MEAVAPTAVPAVEAYLRACAELIAVPGPFVGSPRNISQPQYRAWRVRLRMGCFGWRKGLQGLLVWLRRCCTGAHFAGFATKGQLRGLACRDSAAHGLLGRRVKERGCRRNPSSCLLSLRAQRQPHAVP